MDIAFRARNVEVPEPLRGKTLDRVARLGRVLATERADVCFSEERNPRIAEKAVCAIALYGPGPSLRAQAAAADPAVAADLVLEKLRHRLERFGGRRVGGEVAGGAVAMAGWAGSVHFGAHRHRTGCDPTAATAVTTPPTTEAMTPEEAALEMAQLRYDFYFFINAETAGAAVVYRGRNGDIGLIDVGA